MPKTIEQKLYAYYEAEKDEHNGITYDCAEDEPTLEQLTAAITDPWNAALKAMQAVVKRNVREYSNCEWFCHYCKGSDVCEPERHVKGACYAAECQAAIAAMEGDLHETENVVE